MTKNTPSTNTNPASRLYSHIKNTKRNTLIFWLLVLLVVSLAFFLRIYRIGEMLMFLSDQGRDAIVLKRLVTLEKMVFVGPTTSIGNVFTGPFYYYLVAPFMAMWRLDPVGPAYGIAIINTLGLLICSLAVSRLFNRKIALVFLILAAFSGNQIMQSRFSWNPNPLPVFAFGSILTFFSAYRSQNKYMYAISGVLFGISLQLHYIAIVLPLFALGILRFDRKSIVIGDKVRNVLLGMTIMILMTVISFTPLILFELKNGFINTQALLRATSTGEVQAKNTNFADRLAETTKGYLSHTFSTEIFDANQAFTVFLILLILTIFIAWKKRDKESLFVRGVIVVIVANILALSRLETGRHVHYYNPVYFGSFFICGYVFDRAFRFIKSNYWRYTILAVSVFFLGLFLYRQLSMLTFLTEPKRQSNQITHARKVAEYIISQKKSEQYQVVGLPFYETEAHYRYYLEILGHRPMPADTLGDPKELFVICHELNKKNCDIPGNAQWQIADFQNRHPKWKFEKNATKDIEHIRVYKMVY